MSGLERYRIVRRLGRGGQAEVFEGVLEGEAGFRRRVAVKRLLPELRDDLECARMFLDEARIGSLLHHPELVSVLDFGVHAGVPTQILELVEGADLARLLRRAADRGAALPEPLARYVAERVARGLHSAHVACDDAGRPLGIIHRDVSPANVLVSRTGQVKLSDFGVALARDRLARTEGHAVKGKLAYMAPEQATRGALDARSDVFSLGCTLHTLLCGASPIADLAALSGLALGEALPLDPALAPDVRVVLARALAGQKAHRYTSAAELADALSELLTARGPRERAAELGAWVCGVLDAPAEAGRGPSLMDALFAVPEVSDDTPAPSAWSEIPLAPVPAPVPTSAQHGPPMAPEGPARAAQRPRWPIVLVTAALAATALLVARPQPAPRTPPPLPEVREQRLEPPAPVPAAGPVEPTPRSERPADAPTSPAKGSAGARSARRARPRAEPSTQLGTLLVGGPGAQRAALRVDGRTAGFAPKRLSLPVGEHTVELIPPGGAALQHVVTLRAEHTDSAPLRAHPFPELRGPSLQVAGSAHQPARAALAKTRACSRAGAERVAGTRLAMVRAGTAFAGARGGDVGAKGWSGALLGLLGVLGCGHEGPAASEPPREREVDGGPITGTDHDGGSALDDGGADTRALPCEVDEFLATHCRSCHDGRSGKAPRALVTRADLTAVASDGESVAHYAVARLADAQRPMPPAGLLPAGVVAPFVDWVDAGMHEGVCAGDARLPFEPISPVSALAKVKTLLTGEAVTDDEAARYLADPDALPGLIDGYLASPRAEQKLLRFFQTAFQQTELLPNSLADQLGVKRLNGDPKTLARLVDNVQQSFARTALAIVREGRPFTDVLTTTRFELSTALISLLLTHDVHHVDDQGKLTQPPLAFDVLTEGTTPIAFEDAIRSASTELHFTAFGSTGTCATTLRRSRDAVDLFAFLLGAVPRAAGCNVAVTTPVLGDADFSDFRSVQVVPGESGQGPRFFDLPALRTLTTLPLATPRVGFFTTPAFFANWPTNDANQARVTANQTLIVALFASYDGSDPSEPLTRDGLSAEHGGEGTACYACHKTLDPMRMFFRQSFTYAYGAQRDASVRAQAASFDLDGIGVRGQGVAELGRALAAQPRFASAWVRKLCAYANAQPCAPDDPEVARVAQAFVDARYDFKVLVRTLFSSPLVTGAATTVSAQSLGFAPSILRKNHLCDALSTRLGLDDACGLGLGVPNARQRSAEVVASTIPADAYSRGAEVPVTLSDTSLFFQGATDNLCAIMAASSVDVTAGARYRPSALDAALSDMVASVMNLPAVDPRRDGALAVLRGHYRDAVAGGASPLVALRSTFVLACAAPSSVAIGL